MVAKVCRSPGVFGLVDNTYGYTVITRQPIGTVIPAKAGIHGKKWHWIPTFVGMTARRDAPRQYLPCTQYAP